MQHTKSDCSRELFRFFPPNIRNQTAAWNFSDFFPYNIRNQTAAGNFSDFFPYNIRNQTAAGNFSDFFPYNIRNQTAAVTFSDFFPYIIRNQAAAGNFSNFSYIQHTKSDSNRELLRSFFHTTYGIRLQQETFTIFFHKTY